MKIFAIKAVTTKGGKPNVLVSTIDGKNHWVPYGSWNAHGNSLSLEGYVGGEFEADYFQEGELLLSGDAVTASNVILRDFTASMNPAVLAGIAALEVKAQSEKMLGAAAAFRARRAQAAAVVAAPVSPAEA